MKQPITRFQLPTLPKKKITKRLLTQHFWQRLWDSWNQFSVDQTPPAINCGLSDFLHLSATGSLQILFISVQATPIHKLNFIMAVQFTLIYVCIGISHRSTLVLCLGFTSCGMNWGLNLLSWLHWWLLSCSLLLKFLMHILNLSVLLIMQLLNL